MARIMIQIILSDFFRFQLQELTLTSDLKDQVTTKGMVRLTLNNCFSNPEGKEKNNKKEESK